MQLRTSFDEFCLGRGPDASLRVDDMRMRLRTSFDEFCRSLGLDFFCNCRSPKQGERSLLEESYQPMQRAITGPKAMRCRR